MAMFRSRRSLTAQLSRAAVVLWCCFAAVVAAPEARAQEDQLRLAAVEAIQRAQLFLESSQAPDGSWSYNGHDAGATALVAMSLMYSGRTPQDETVQRALDYLRSVKIPDDTYEVSLMAMALSLSGDSRFEGRIRTLAQWLVETQRKPGDNAPGSWTYGRSRGGHWDNSNTQFALLGLREAVHAGVEIPAEVWELSQQHFLTHKQGSVDAANGVQFFYNDGSPTTSGSMQVAGISSLSITSAMLGDDDGIAANGEFDCCAPRDDTVHRTIEAAFRWLGNNGNFDVRVNANTGDEWFLYYLYGLERAGRFTGRRFIGTAERPHDWYREGVRHLVTRVQNVNDGSFTDMTTRPNPVVGTAFALMFISKGNSPVLINKLQYDDPDGKLYGRGWNRQPRDAANLADAVSMRPRWPRLLSWQVVDLGVAAREQDGAALLQAKVQLLTGDGPPRMSDAEVALLRDYIQQGGFLLAVNTCGGKEFEAGLRELLGRMFPQEGYKLEKLPPTHDVYRSEHVLLPEEAGAALELWGVDFGCRTAIMYAPFDHACRWDKWMPFDPPRRPLAAKTQIKRSMELAVNIIAYATGRELLDALTEPQRLARADDNVNRRGRLEIARLRHTGGWDTAPSALRHLQLALNSVGIATTPEAPNVAATDPALADYPLLYMHGRKNFRMTDAEEDGLKNYLDLGGFLFADACCGDRQFDESFRMLVRELFNRDLEAIPLDHPLYHSPLGHDVREVKRRLPIDTPAGVPLQSEYRSGPPILEGITDDKGRYFVVYSKYDLSCALERQATVNCAGYASEDAARIATNIVVYALSQ